MKTKLTSARRPARALRQRGVVLFIALIAMVVLSLAGVALIRSVDTAGSVAGNIAFREASTTAVNLAVEQAVNWVFVTGFNVELDNAPFHYYAKLQPPAVVNGVTHLDIPAVLSGTYTMMKGTYPFGAADIYPSTKIEVRSVIERVCAPTAAGSPALPMSFPQKVQWCDQLPPKVSVAKTTMKKGGPTLPPIPLYRLTVRVDVPSTNTTTYAQAMLR